MIAAIGAFDGFHRGHRSLLEIARERAASIGTTWGTVTFTRHPDALFSSLGFKSLFTSEELLILEEYFDIPSTRKIDFTRKIADMTPREFLDYISLEFGVRGVVVGEDFRFGRGRVGDKDTLRQECLGRGWECDIVPTLFTGENTPVSSTEIRESVSEGDMPRARDMLGYPFFCLGRVVHGNERGRELGYPTANIDMNPLKVTSRRGVYATVVRAMGNWYAGSANIGFNPTFTDVQGIRFEVNLIGFDGCLYDKRIAVFMLEHIRDERRFDGPDSLKRQMALDADSIEAIGQRELTVHSRLWKKWASILSVD
ncbi:MAG: riboflavin biosynthesis protein RibF [Synergistaceae bacterium]|jgi:riboflavin kinase/FMN adenylyltransferase|nr:riboflavin biosynthesis protein RibF [Synergistaceae bacterium]